MTPDFCGCATKYNVRCDDGLIIAHGAFADCDGKKVPLVYNHRHGSIKDVLGNAVLHNEADGVYAECYLNDTEAGRTARDVLAHGDIGSLSIFANQLTKKGPTVTRGNIRELSVVLAGCNPGATIDSSTMVVHGILTEEDDECYYIDCNEPVDIIDEDFLAHAATEDDEDDDDETNEDIFNTLNEKQKDVVYQLIGMAIDAARNGELDDDGEDDDEVDSDDDSESAESNSKEAVMKHSAFDSQTEETITTSAISPADMAAAFDDGKRYGSLKDSCLAHGITNLEYAFPNATLLDNPPTLISRDMGWVKYVMSKVHRSPFANIKSLFADITADEARARGYIKGNLKKEEVFTMLKRTTGPTTVYKKQKMDRDDIIDIVDFDVVSYIKAEMRTMLDEELARAFLIGDGRLASSDDKIKEDRIRPIAREEALFTVHAQVTGKDPDELAKNFIRQAILARKDYKGSGRPDLFITEEMLTRMLLLTDNNGRDLYVDEAALARKMRVANIITVPVMEGYKDANDKPIHGIIVNLADYNVGADRGGAVAMFDDFDIDYNKQTYLIETRCSGALVKPYSAIILGEAAPATGASTFSGERTTL